MSRPRSVVVVCAILAAAGAATVAIDDRFVSESDGAATRPVVRSQVTVATAVARDVSGPLDVQSAETLASLSSDGLMDRDAPLGTQARVPRYSLSAEPNDVDREREAETDAEAAVLPVMTTPVGSADVEQTVFGTRPPAVLAASFDGLGVGFTGPQGTANLRNPSDNTLAVGPNHIMQIVNTRMAIFTKKGKQFDTTGLVLYGPGETRNVFKGFGGACEARNNGDAVVRYDQLADRWLIVMPIFSRLPVRQDAPPASKGGEPAKQSVRGQVGQPGSAAKLYEPPPAPVDSARSAG